MIKVLVICAIGMVISGVAVSRAASPSAERQSSYALMSADTKAMQDDPLLNPATFAVLDGQALWQESVGKKNRSCATCHGDATTSMKGVAASFPKFNSAKGSLVNLEGQINDCRVKHQEAEPLAYESKPLLSLSAFVGTQSKGMPITVERNAANATSLDAGQHLFKVSNNLFIQ